MSGASSGGAGGTTATGMAGTPAMTGGGQVGTAGTPAAGGSLGVAGTATTGGTGSGTCPPYTGTLAKDSTIFMSGFGKSTMGMWSGYAYTYKYGTATVAPGMGTSCFAMAKLCANGSVPADDMSGAGLGWNIGQMMGATTTTKVPITTPVKLTFAGVTAGMRVQLSASATDSYCYAISATDITAGSATIPPASFTAACWAPDAPGLAYAGTPIEAIQLVVPGAAAGAKTFDMCLLDIEPG